MHMRHVGISGFSVYTPRLRVSLEDWCSWYGQPWDKISAVIGRSFRIPGPSESVYTMAATAALDLIERYSIDPREVGLLALGTESSTDNAAGAVIVRGMLDQALRERGSPPISRSCEVPELKHACLGGVYAIKAAARYLATDGHARKAIVVCADIAEYERGSTGEPTQGAGAVAILLEADPKLLRLELGRTGSSSSYRGLDFRKPAQRHRVDGYAPTTKRHHDFPVFNGRYSSHCYLEAVTSATLDLLDRIDGSPEELFDGLAAIFMHRPYHHMPQGGLISMFVAALARSASGRRVLAELCESAGIDLDELIAEMERAPDLYSVAMDRGLAGDPRPLTSAAQRAARSHPSVTRLLDEKMRLGADAMRDLGNVYSAALPAWIAAGLEEAARLDLALEGEPILAVGYGSGDAAEALIFEVAPGYREAARSIGFSAALADPGDLDRDAYEALHDRRELEGESAPPRGFFVERVGDSLDAAKLDVGIEYYRYAGRAGASAR
jgi:hydroxymethylglutaryl-CoA synthase